MKMTRYEQEVIINFNADDDYATMYSANPIWLRKMDKLAEEFPGEYLIVKQTSISKTYKFPKKLLRIGKPRQLSAAQKENLERMRSIRNSGGKDEC